MVKTHLLDSKSGTLMFDIRCSYYKGVLMGKDQVASGCTLVCFFGPLLGQLDCL